MTPTVTNQNTTTPIISHIADKINEVPHGKIIALAVLITLGICVISCLGYCFCRRRRGRTVRVRRGDRIELQPMS